MSETRDKQIVVNIEPTLFDIVSMAAQKDSLSASSYLRNLIIKDLLSRGLVSEHVLAQVMMS